VGKWGGGSRKTGLQSWRQDPSRPGDGPEAAAGTSEVGREIQLTSEDRKSQSGYYTERITMAEKVAPDQRFCCSFELG